MDKVPSATILECCEFGDFQEIPNIYILDLWPLGTEKLMVRIVVWENALESPLDCREIKPFNPEGNQS